MNENDNQKQSGGEPITTVERFIQWTQKLKGTLLLYRGLADSDWEVEASAFRRLDTKEKTPLGFQNCITRLLKNADLQGFRQQQGRKLSDLELLAQLQHNGAATCFIDFTDGPLVALWFACSGQQDKDGKVIAMTTDNLDKFAEIEPDRLKWPIKEFLNKEKLWKWKPYHLSNRTTAQQSVFVFGKRNIEESYYKEAAID